MAFALGTSAGAGTITVAQGSAVVTGVGTSFASTDIGKIIVVGSQWGIIGTFVSTTSVAFTTPFATAVTASAYQISARIPIITQSGTDTSLAGLTGVPGVTTSPSVTAGIWTITSASLVVTGTLTINRLFNRLRFLNPNSLLTASTTQSVFSISGTFNNSISQTTGGYSFHSPNYSILFEGAPTGSSTVGNLIGTTAASTSVFEGNIEFNLSASTSPLTFILEGNTTVQYGAFVNASVVGANVQFTTQLDASTLTINSWAGYGCGLRVLGNTTNINNYISVGAAGAVNNASGNAVNNPIYAGLQDFGNAPAFRTVNASLKYFQMLNFVSNKSSAGLATNNIGSSTLNSQILLTNSLVVTAQDSVGVVQDMKLWAKDSNNGSRCSANYGAGLGFEIATTGDLTYTGTTSASGTFTFPSIISAIFWQPITGSSTLTTDWRGNGGALSQNLVFYSCSYKHNLAQQTPDLYAYNSATGLYNTIAAKNATYLLLTDTSITQTTMATVAAYTTLDTAQQFYDYAKYYLWTNFAGQTATYVTRAGNTITAGSYNVIIDATAATPFVFAGSTITAKSSNFSGSLTTSGAVTLANGAVFSNNTVTANVAQATPTDLTGVTITGNLTYNTNTPITVTFTNCSISGTVSNSGTGAVTISTSNSTIGTTGSNVTKRIVTSLNINGLTAGSQIYVADGSGTQVAYVASSSTSYTLDTTGQTGTWTWKVARYGYTAQTGTHSPAAAITTTTVTLVADAFITQATKATVAAYTSLPNMDTLYDYAAYYETTNAGIPYARIITKAGTSASAGSYPVEIVSSGSVWTFTGSSLTFNAGSSLAPGATITGSLFTSSTVTIPTTFGNTAITANVLQLTPGNLSGMTITGNLTYNTNSILTVTITNSTISGTISNSGTAQVKVIKAGTSPFFTAGTNVTVVAVVTITTANSLALSTYVIKNGSVDLGWVVQNTARSLEVQQADTFSIYAVAYGYQPVLFSAVATDPTSFRTSLTPETYVDTTLNTTIRDAIAATINVSIVGSNVVGFFSSDLSAYSPANVLNGFQYYTVIGGDQIALAALLVGSVNGVTIVNGGLLISSPQFYAQVSNSVTTVGPAGFSIPLVAYVAASVYVTDPTYTPTRKNTSGIVLQTAPWTQQTATISQSDKTSIALTTWDTPKASVTTTDTMGAVVKSTNNSTNLIPALL